MHSSHLIFQQVLRKRPTVYNALIVRSATAQLQTLPSHADQSRVCMSLFQHANGVEYGIEEHVFGQPA